MRLTPNNFAVLSSETLLHMKRQMEDQLGHYPSSRLAQNPIDRFMGMPVSSSPVFPYQAQCPKCDGSGHGGKASTYCQHCNGAGENRFVGMMANGGTTTLITTPLPRKFNPEFPRDLVPPPRPCRIVI